MERGARVSLLQRLGPPPCVRVEVAAGAAEGYGPLARPRPCAAADEGVIRKRASRSVAPSQEECSASPLVRLVWQSVRCSQREHRPERRDSHGCSFQRDCLQAQSSVHEADSVAGRSGDEGRMTCPPGHSTLITGTPRPPGGWESIPRSSGCRRGRESSRGISRRYSLVRNGWLAAFARSSRLFPLARRFRRYEGNGNPRARRLTTILTRKTGVHHANRKLIVISNNQYDDIQELIS